MRGVWVDDDGHETLFYKGRATGLTVTGGDPTPVIVNVDFVPDFPDLEPEQLEQLIFLADQDDDNYTIRDGDCNDHNAHINPGAPEECNEIDDNCNGMADEPYRTFYLDDDGDGYGTESQSVQSCSAPVDYVEKGEDEKFDCDDSNPDINPGEDEINCDGLDNNCDGEKICDKPDGTYYLDADGDGFGDQSQSRQGFREGYVLDSTDCDDTKENVNPDADEICNGIDDNCDDQTDEGLLNEYHPDDDKDGFGDLNQTWIACVAPAGWVADGSDCNDENNAIHPNMAEQCNGIDDDCNGKIDDGVTTATYYADLDGDGFGDPDQPAESCAAPTGHVENSTDCDDSNRDVNPGAEEVCNKVDDNCDGQIDEGCPWNNIFGEADSQDYAWSIAQGNNGGYVIAGDSSAGGWIFKIDENGYKLWDQIFSESDPLINTRAIIPGNKGGYVIAGWGRSFDADTGASRDDALVLKIDENGEILLEKTVGSANDDTDASVITPCNTGGYVIVGESGLGAWIVKIDETGETLWEKTFSSADHRSHPRSITPLINGGYIIAGTTLLYGSGKFAAWVIKIDESGNRLWENTYGGTNNSIVANSLTPGNTGGYIIAGFIMPDGALTFDMWVSKIDENGDELWHSKLEYGPTENENANFVIQGNSGGYLLVGDIASNGINKTDGLIVKIDEYGNSLSHQTYDLSKSDTFCSVISGNESGYVAIGGTTAIVEGDSIDNIWIIKMDENGNAPASPSINP